VSSFMALLQFITTQNNTSILSTPQIIALDNEKAEFKVQDDIPVLEGVTPSAPGTSVSGLGGYPTGTIGRKKVGIQIKLTPHVNATTRNIRLEIEQTVDNIKNNASPKGLSDVQVATTSRETNTTVVVKDSDYLMMGGLMSDTVSESTTKVPLLGDIPILGWLFKAKICDIQKTNLVILLHPRIIGTSVSAANTAEEYMKKRDNFIEKEFDGKDEYKKRTDQVKDDLRDQESRGKNERVFDYRNNDEEEEAKLVPGQQSELDPKTLKKSSYRDGGAPETSATPASNSGSPPGPTVSPPPPADDAPLLGSPGSVETPPIMPPVQSGTGG
jgi:general secretion pathway protein D